MGAVVLDSGALIQGTNLRAIGAEYFTVEQVITEVRDKRARDVLRDLSDSIKVLEPSEEDLLYAVEFAKKTGDFTSLSRTDLRVIALAVRLEKERNGGLVLRDEPLPIQQMSTRVTQVKDKGVKILQDSEASEQALGTSEAVARGEEQQEQQSGLDREETGLEGESQSLEEDREATGLEEEGEEEPGLEEDKEETGVDEETGEDSKSDEEGWITPHNYKQTANTAADWNDPTTRVMTSDFPVQNVVLQMGLKLVAIDGRTVKHIKRWVLKCQGCKVIVHDSTKEFCPSCGNHTLVKISCFVDSSGTVKYSGGPRRPMLRGTKYSIPTHKGGKDVKNIILREDELLMMGGRQYSWLNKKKTNPLDFDSMEWAGLSLKQHTTARFGPTRRNPNEPVKKQGKRKRR
jgi:RNA-binding protein NOB1